MPTIHLRTPLFSFPNDAANAALEAVFEKEAAEHEKWFVGLVAAKGGEASVAILRWECAPTLVRPRLASVRCEGFAELSTLGASILESAHTLAVDGSKVRPMKPREFFLPDKPGADGFTARATVALQSIVGACSGGSSTKKITPSEVDARIAGFTVDAKGMTILSTDLGCSAAGFEARIEWDDVQPNLDPKGGIARVRE